MLIYDYKKRRLLIDKSGVLLTIKGKDYLLKRLSDEDAYVGMNINSWVGRAKECNGGSGENKYDWVAVKICALPIDADRDQEKAAARVRRFRREIDAMKNADDGKQECVLTIFDDFEVSIVHRYADKTEITHKHLGFSMELADKDLDAFLREDLSFDSRVVLCYDILRNLKWLHEKQIYHRDIKPANFFIVENKCKIGDLGLICHRSEDLNSVDEPLERIGPIAFLTPEAINKTYAVGTDREWAVGEKSDIHQVAKMLWFILQKDIPNGIIQLTDFNICPDVASALYGNVFKPAMLYSAVQRPTIDILCESFKNVMKRFL